MFLLHLAPDIVNVYIQVNRWSAANRIVRMIFQSLVAGLEQAGKT